MSKPDTAKRPISSAVEQPSRFVPVPAVVPRPPLDRNAASLVEPWLNQQFTPVYINGNGGSLPPLPPDLGQAGLPTISWLCSCNLCVESVKQFLSALRNSNVYAACISGCGPVYTELLGSANIQMQPPPQILTSSFPSGVIVGNDENISVASIGIGSDDANVSVKVDTTAAAAAATTQNIMENEDRGSVESDGNQDSLNGAGEIIRPAPLYSYVNGNGASASASSLELSDENDFDVYAPVPGQVVLNGGDPILEIDDSSDGAQNWVRTENWEPDDIDGENEFAYSNEYNGWNGFDNQMDIFDGEGGQGSSNSSLLEDA